MSKIFQVSQPNLAKDQTKPTKAFCDITIANAVKLKGVRIVKGEKGFFLSMASKPQTKWNDDTKKWDNVYDPETGKQLYSDHYMPVSEEIRAEMTSAVLAAYNAKIESDKAMASSPQA